MGSIEGAYKLLWKKQKKSKLMYYNIPKVLCVLKYFIF